MSLDAQLVVRFGVGTVSNLSTPILVTETQERALSTAVAITSIRPSTLVPPFRELGCLCDRSVTEVESSDLRDSRDSEITRFFNIHMIYYDIVMCIYIYYIELISVSVVRLKLSHIFHRHQVGIATAFLAGGAFGGSEAGLKAPDVGETVEKTWGNSMGQNGQNGAKFESNLASFGNVLADGLYRLFLAE